MPSPSCSLHLRPAYLVLLLLVVGRVAADDKAALLAFKAGGDPGNELGGWNAASEPCGASHWYGIGCDTAGRRVVSLDLDSTYVTGDLSAVSGLTELSSLDLHSRMHGDITGDLSAVSGLTELSSLSLYSTAVTGDLSAVSGLTELRVLDLGWTAVTGDLSAVSGLTELSSLDLHCTAVTGDLSAVSGLTELS
eukprot:COSAG02_NODE_13715_length_1357_cov_3.469793_1_plen_192_part_01